MLFQKPPNPTARRPQMTTARGPLVANAVPAVTYGWVYGRVYGQVYTQDVHALRGLAEKA